MPDDPKPDDPTRRTHTCAAPRCGAEIPIEYLMCAPHWFKVPRHLRIKCTSAFRGWQAGTASVEALRGAQAECVAAIAGDPPRAA